MSTEWERNSNRIVVLWMVVIVAYLMSGLEASASAYSPPASATDWVRSAREWWRVFANLTVIGGSIAALVMYLFYPKFLGVAIVITLIAAAGEPVTSWLLSTFGGADHVISGK